MVVESPLHKSGRLQCADDRILPPKRGGIVRRAHPGLEFGDADAQRQPIRPYRIEMRARITQETSCPASASRTAKWLPTAPGAENAYPHVKEVLLEGMLVPTGFTSLVPTNRSAAQGGLRSSRP